MAKGTSLVVFVRGAWFGFIDTRGGRIASWEGATGSSLAVVATVGCDRAGPKRGGGCVAENENLVLTLLGKSVYSERCPTRPGQHDDPVLTSSIAEL